MVKARPKVRIQPTRDSQRINERRRTRSPSGAMRTRLAAYLGRNIAGNQFYKNISNRFRHTLLASTWGY